MAVIIGTGTVELPGGHVLDGLTVHGECAQDGTPTPDAPVGMEIVDLLPPNDWYTIDLGYVELPDVRDASTLSVIADVEPEIDVTTSPYEIAGGGCFDERA